MQVGLATAEVRCWHLAVGNGDSPMSLLCETDRTALERRCSPVTECTILSTPGYDDRRVGLRASRAMITSFQVRHRQLLKVLVGGTLIPKTCEKRRKKKCPTSLFMA